LGLLVILGVGMGCTFDILAFVKLFNLFRGFAFVGFLDILMHVDGEFIEEILGFFVGPILLQHIIVFIHGW